jgi:hypothetical protein
VQVVVDESGVTVRMRVGFAHVLRVLAQVVLIMQVRVVVF